MARLRLKRYMDRKTDWRPVFVLEKFFDSCLIREIDGDSSYVKTFDTIDEAIDWVAENIPEASIEWEGTTF